MSNLVTKSASRFRIVLIISIVLSILIVVAVVIFGIGWLNQYARTVNEVAIESHESEKQLERMRAEAGMLQDLSDVAKRAEQIVAQSQDYQHQDVIIRDLQAFASKAGVRVLSYDFTAADTTAAPSQAQTPATPAPAPATGGGLKSTSVSITLENPVDYNHLLRFMHYIEQNLTKMQIANVTLSKTEGSDSQVTSGSFVIEVYIR